MAHLIEFRPADVDPKIALKKQRKFVTVDIGNGMQTVIDLGDNTEHFGIAIQALKQLGVPISQLSDLIPYVKGSGLVVEPGSKTHFQDLTQHGAISYSTLFPEIGIDIQPRDSGEAQQWISEIRTAVQALFPKP